MSFWSTPIPLSEAKYILRQRQYAFASRKRIEPAFSSIQVFDATGKQVDKKDTHSDRSNRSLLQISLPPLGPGTYKVVWGVVSVDTHVTKGDFSFQILR